MKKSHYAFCPLNRALDKLEKHLKYKFNHNYDINESLSNLNDVYSPVKLTRLHHSLINPLFNFK